MLYLRIHTHIYITRGLKVQVNTITKSYFFYPQQVLEHGFFQLLTIYVFGITETKALELNNDSHAFASWEINLFLGDSEQDEVEKSDGGASVANPMSKNSEDAKEVAQNVVITEQIAEEKHGDHEHHMAEDVSQMEGTHLAVSDEPNCQNHDGSNQQGEVAAITQGNVGGCEKNYGLIKVESLSNFKYSEILMDAAEINGSNHVTADEAMVECGHNELKQVENIANPGTEDINFSAEMDDYEHIIAVELGQDLPKIHVTMEEISPASTNMVVDRGTSMFWLLSKCLLYV
jgi:hypothetical protein